MAALRTALLLGTALALLAAPLRAQDEEEPQAAEPQQAEVHPERLVAAVDYFDALMGEDEACLRDDEWLDAEDLTPSVYALPAHPETGEAGLLFQFLCHRAAYNESYSFLAMDASGGFRLLQFPAPTIEVHYENDDSDGEVRAIQILGLELRHRLTNASYDPATGEIGEYSRWRGLGDASSEGVWRFEHEDVPSPLGGNFKLTSYHVDASYDGEMNPVQILPTPAP